jgi:hypothetical protein
MYLITILDFIPSISLKKSRDRIFLTFFPCSEAVASAQWRFSLFFKHPVFLTLQISNSGTWVCPEGDVIC